MTKGPLAARHLERTPLHGEHLRLNAKMVPFAGYEMPVHYPGGITAEHRAVREAAGLFDVSHMGELEVRGNDALALVQRVTVNDASRLEPFQAQYSAMCNADGGVLDDLVVYRFEDHYMLVVNASNREKDLAWVVDQAAGLDAQVIDRSDQTGLLALQGPAARETLRALADLEVDDVVYYRFGLGRVAGVLTTVSGTGYTGEDGFELYVPAEHTVTLWKALLEAGKGAGLVPVGLGARDSLRLEMGYALHGNDLDEEHTPLEAGLGWLTKLDKGDFVGRSALAAQKEKGVTRKLVGLVLSGRAFPRPGYPIRAQGREVGRLTSGTLSPTLGEGIALGYLSAELARPGARVEVDVRGTEIPAQVVRTPFYTQGSLRRS